MHFWFIIISSKYRGQTGQVLKLIQSPGMSEFVIIVKENFLVKVSNHEIRKKWIIAGNKFQNLPSNWGVERIFDPHFSAKKKWKIGLHKQAQEYPEMTLPFDKFFFAKKFCCQLWILFLTENL